MNFATICVIIGFCFFMFNVINLIRHRRYVNKMCEDFHRDMENHMRDNLRKHIDKLRDRYEK